MEYLGKDKETGEHIYDTGTQTIRSATPPASAGIQTPAVAPPPQTTYAPGSWGAQGFPAAQEQMPQMPGRIRDVLTLGGRIGQGSEEFDEGQRAQELLMSRNLPFTMENLNAARAEVRAGTNPLGSSPDLRIPMSDDPSGGKQIDTGGVPTKPEPEQVSFQQGPLPAQIPGMASIKGQLGTLKGEIKAEKIAQDIRYKKAEENYRTHLDEVDEQSQEDEARWHMDKAKGALNTATERLKSWDINPQRAFPTAFSKMAAVIGVSMGAYAQGLSGGKLPNTALQIVDAAIDRDIDAQKAEYRQLKGLVDEKRNVYGMAMRLLGDERQADEMARTAAYRSFNAGITSMSKQFGLSNQENARMLQALGLEAQENYHRANLFGTAAKGAARAGKLPKEMAKAASSFGAIQATAKSLWEDVGKFSLGPLTGVGHAIWPGEQLGDTFNRESKQALVEMLHSISGVALSPGEFDRINKFFPNSKKLESTNRADLIGLVDWAAKKGAGFYKTLTPQQKGIMNQASPELVQLYLEKDPDRRKTIAVSILSQQSVSESGGDFFGEATRIKE